MFINLKDNMKFYQNYNDVCSCDFCRYYIDKVDEYYPNLSKYLKSNNIDFKKPWEVDLPYIDKNDNLVYPTVQYISMGTCDDNYSYSIEGLTISKASFFAEADLLCDYFVIEISFIIFKSIIDDQILKELKG